MRTCPHCGSAVPMASMCCPSCGRPVHAPPPVHAPRLRKAAAAGVAPGAPPWVPVAYNLTAAYWVLNGAWLIVQMLILDPKGPKYLASAVAALPVLVGIGLLLRVEIVRGIVNVISALQILTGVLGTFGAFLAGEPLAMIQSLVQIAMAGFMIYLIGETESRAPDL